MDTSKSKLYHGRAVVRDRSEAKGQSWTVLRDEGGGHGETGEMARAGI
jgi:hypothetical protein